MALSEWNAKLKEENFVYQEKNENLKNKTLELETEVLNKQSELNLINWRINSVEEAEEKIYTATKEKYEAKLINDYSELNTEYSKKHEKLAENYVQAKTEAEEEYLKILSDFKENFIKEQEIDGNLLLQLRNQLQEEQKLVEVAVAARKRQEEEETQKEFYRLQIPNNDLEDIEKLNNVANLLNTPEVLYKTIWKVYYEKPYNDLIGRVLGKNPITGIYKITNINNGKSYVGQSANIQDRWRQHIKRGCGAEAPTRNKLYPAMLEEGVHNFYFELLEECPREKLDKQEDYWQSFFQTTSYGYSIK